VDVIREAHFELFGEKQLGEVAPAHSAPR
jgi:hypothetical protein